MERSRRLADRLAIPAGELLPDNLHHLPLPRHDLQCLGDVLAQLGKPITRSRGRCAGNGLRAGFLRAKARTDVVAPAALSAANSSSAPVASNSSSCSSI